MILMEIAHRLGLQEIDNAGWRVLGKLPSGLTIALQVRKGTHVEVSVFPYRIPYGVSDFHAREEWNKQTTQIKIATSKGEEKIVNEINKRLDFENLIRCSNLFKDALAEHQKSANESLNLANTLKEACFLNNADVRSSSSSPHDHTITVYPNNKDSYYKIGF